MAANEELLIEVEGMLFSLEIVELLRIADVLKVPRKDVSGKTKFKLIKFLSTVLEDLHDSKSSDEFFQKASKRNINLLP